MTKFTRWFSCDIWNGQDPVRKGVYQISGFADKKLRYSLWDGRGWRMTRARKNAAAKETGYSVLLTCWSNRFQWRGLAKQVKHAE